MATYKQISAKKGKTWEAQGTVGYLHDERITKQKRGFKTKQEAKQWFKLEMINFEKKLENGEFEETDEPTIQVIYEEWVKFYEPTVEPSTFVKSIRLLKNHVLDIWGSFKISEIKRSDLQNYVMDLQQELIQYRAPIMYFRLIVKFARIKEYTTVDPFELIEFPKQRKSLDRVKSWDSTTFKKFLDILDEQYRYIDPLKYITLRLIALTGIRRGEAVGLKWDCVDLEHGYLTIRRAIGQREHGWSYEKSPKNNSSIRKLKLDDMTLDVLKEWYVMSEFDSDTDFVFTDNGDHLRLDGPNSWFKQIQKIHDLPGNLSIHKLRHTVGSLSLEAGANVKQVQAQLGHATPETTLEVYTHLSDNQRDQTSKMLSDLLGKVNVGKMVGNE